jgi:hypothetical protein
MEFVAAAVLGIVVIVAAMTIFVATIRIAIVLINALKPWLATPRDDRLEKIRSSIADSDLAPVQQNYLLDIYLPALGEYRSTSLNSGRRFRRLAKRGIFYPAIGGVTTTIIAAVPKDYWIVGLVIVGCLSAAGFITSAFDQVERNNDLCRDHKRVADAMENSLRQLLTERLDVPIADRWQQFCIELESIQEMEGQLFERRWQAAQTAASSESVAAQERLQQSRKDYRAVTAPVARPLRQELPVEPLVAAKAQAADWRTSLGMPAPEQPRHSPERPRQSPEQIEINRQQARASVAMQTSSDPMGTKRW